LLLHQRTYGTSVALLHRSIDDVFPVGQCHIHQNFFKVGEQIWPITSPHEVVFRKLPEPLFDVALGLNAMFIVEHWTLLLNDYHL
jgi:hypothetical protein